MTVRQRLGASAYTGLALLVTLGLGALHVAYPFSADQSQTLLGAQALERGGTLYVDLWDLRQPGTVFCYFLADRLFGHLEIGIHLFELCWMAVAAWVAVRIARELTPETRLAGLAPLLTVCMYYAHATPWELTQPEALLMLPLGICLLIALREQRPLSSSSRASIWLAFGIATGVTAVFKLGLVVIPGSLAAIAILRSLRTDGVGRVIQLRVLPALAGFALVVSLVVAHFWSRGALGPLYWTTFVAPSMAMAELPAATLHRLALSTGWFLTIWLAGLPLIWLGLRKVGDRYAVHLLLASIGAATLGIAVQRNFWPYHYLLLVMPVGLLVLVGIVETIERLKNINHPIRIAAFVAAPLLLTACVPVASKMLTLYDATQAPGDFIENYYSKISPPYADLRAAAAAISGPHAREGRIYVFGRPDIVIYAARIPAIPLRGISRESLLQVHWDAFPSLLAAARPVYIFVNGDSLTMMRVRSPGIATLLESSYRPFWSGAAGQWYELADK